MFTTLILTAALYQVKINGPEIMPTHNQYLPPVTVERAHLIEDVQQELEQQFINIAADTYQEIQLGEINHHPIYPTAKAIWRD